MPQLLTPLTLASTSAARRLLLSLIGVDGIEYTSPQVDEEELKPALTHLPVSEQALALAKAKALSVSAHTEGLVIGSDQMGVIDGRILGKPGSREKAHSQLQSLRNRTHEQHTATCITKGDTIVWENVQVSRLTMRNLTDSEINAYLDLDDPIHCCGAYKLEQHGKHLFSAIEGDFDAIAGIPLTALLHALYEMEVLKL